MAFARLVTWKLKPGMREKAFETIDGFDEETKGTEGFKGILAFRSVDDPNIAHILSLWDSEESLNASGTGIFQTITKAVGDMAAEPPSVKVLETREMAAQLISIPA